MKTEVSEIADKIYRLSTFMPQIGPNGFTFNQFLIDADQPLLFHYGQRALFPLISDAVKRVIPLDKLRWTTCSHVEADESGALNQWLAAAPNATPAHGQIGCNIWLTDMADRAAARAQERRGARPRGQEGALARHAARAAQLGCRRDLRGDHRHAVLQRSLHPDGTGDADHRERHRRTPRSPSEDRLPYMPPTRHARADPAPPGGAEAHHHRADARPGVQGRWRRRRCRRWRIITGSGWRISAILVLPRLRGRMQEGAG